MEDKNISYKDVRCLPDSRNWPTVKYLDRCEPHERSTL